MLGQDWAERLGLCHAISRIFCLRKYLRSLWQAPELLLEVSPESLLPLQVMKEFHIRIHGAW